MPSQFQSTVRSLEADTARPAMVAWVVGGAFVGAWLLWFFAGGVTLNEVSRRARLEVVRAPHPVASPIGGRLAFSDLAVGRTVGAGDLLLELDAGPERRRLEEEESRLAGFPRRLAAVHAEVAVLRAALAADLRSTTAAVRAVKAREREAQAASDFAADHALRLAEESRTGSVAQIDALRARADASKLAAAREALGFDARRVELEAATRTQQVRGQIAALNGTAAALEAEMATARAAVSRLGAEIERMRVRAPVDGRVADVLPLKPGAYVAEGQTLATILPAGDLMVVAELDPATALGRVAPGQRARLTLDGFPWAQYGAADAIVQRVANEIRDGVLRAELALEGADRVRVPLQHGMPARVEIAVERVSPALLALRSAGQAIGGDGQAARRPVAAR